MRAREIIREWYDEDEENLDNLKSIEDAKKLRPELIKAAQQVYDDWNEEDVDTYAGGGICHLIADEFCNILGEHGINCSTISSTHEQHVYVIAQVEEGVYSIDLHWSCYETGGGFCWKKIPNVVLHPDEITFYRNTSDPAEFKNYLDPY